MECDADTRQSWTNTSANLTLLSVVTGEERKDGEWTLSKQACLTELLVPKMDQERTYNRKQIGTGYEVHNNSSSSDESSESSSREYSDSDSCGADEPELKKSRIDKSDNTSSLSQQVKDQPPVISTMLSPRSFNRQLLNSVNLEDLSDLSSVSSMSSDGYSDLLRSPRSNPRPVEFEVASTSPIILNPIEDCNSSSGLEDEEQMKLNRLITRSSDSQSWSQIDEDENFADSEFDSDELTEKSYKSSGFSSDSEISESKDQWNCNLCHVKSNKPYMQYCLRCFKIRRDWLPTRPKSRRLKSRRSKKLKPEFKHQPNSLEAFKGEEPATPAEEAKLSQSVLSSSQDSNTEQEKDLNLYDKLQYILDSPPPVVNETIEQESEKDLETCSICMVRDKNAAFVHGKTAHRYSCYTCADKILKKSGKCPICRKTILRVVKVISV